MKFLGQSIYDFISRFRSDIYLESLSSTKNNQVLLIDENEKVTTLDSFLFLPDVAASYGIESSSAGRQTLFIGEDNNLVSYIAKKNHSDGAGGKLNITAGSATATTSGNDAAGGNLNLYSGRGTGGGTSHVTINTSTTIAGTASALQTASTTWDFQGKVHSNPYAILEVDDDFALLSQGNMMFGIDSDNNETSQGWSWNNNAVSGGGTSVMSLSEAGNLQVDGTLQVDGGTLTFDSVGLTAIQTSSELSSPGFQDNDTSLMTAAAIDDRINAASGGIAFDGSTANGVLTYKDADEATVEANMTYDGADLTLTSATSGKPILTIENTNTDAVSPILKFAKTDTGTNADEIGRIQFEADDNANNPTVFAEIKGEIQDANSTGNSEDGQLELLIAQGASLVNVLKANSSLGLGTMLEFGDNGVLSMTQFKSTVVQFESSTSTGPIMSAVNTTADAEAPQFTFVKNRGLASGVGSTLDGDHCGLFNFRGYDAAGNVTTYAWIEGTATTTSSTNEAGKIAIAVTSDGNAGDSNRNVITGTGHTTVDKVDIDLGYGAASTTTVAGDLSVTTGLILDSVDVTTIQTSGESFADNDTSLMTSAAIDDRINAAGGGGGSSLIHVDMPKYISIYLFYAFNKDQWYTSPMYTTAITTDATIDGATLSAQYQARGASYIANSACKVKKVTLVFQLQSSTLSGDIDLEWALVKWTPQDDTANTAAMTEMTITNHDGAFTETDVHTLTFTVTDNAASTLAAKDCIAFCMRSVDSGSSTPRMIVYGHGNFEIELT
tara:strand:- start:630 stop:2969 length:2340 start_codon:yes stop_codon:yes gene_type:complete